MLGNQTVRRAKRVAKERAKQLTCGFGFSQKEAGRPVRVGSTIRIIIVPDENAGITVLSARTDQMYRTPAHAPLSSRSAGGR